MTKFADAYVELKPDLSAFGAELGQELKAKLQAIGTEAFDGIDEHKTVHVDVDVDRNRFQRALGSLATDAKDLGQNIASSLGTALNALARSLGGFLGVGSAFSALGDAAAAALPIVAALAVAIGVLAASFAAAVAGAAALGVALAGALGPVALVAFAAIAKIAAIVKAIHDDNQNSAASAAAVAAAQDQIRSATEGLANAQTTLRQQTVAAYRAWQDSIEAVKADLIEVESANEGVEQASINLREAQLELKKFKAEAPGLDAVFKKFTDVNVDLSGLKGALAEVRKASGGKLSEEDSLKLEQLILNVRKAKTDEKAATDRLHQSNVKLQRDRQTEADFLRRGIAAYPGYTSAVQGLASAQRNLASAQRASAAAAVAQAGAVAQLSPIEQKLARTFQIISDGFKTAFGPAINAVLSGLNRGLRIFAGTLTDPRIIGALRNIGRAMGDSLVAIAKVLSAPQMRDAFVELARGGARLVRLFGTRVFRDFLVIFTAIARAALPAMLQLFTDLADVLDRWARWITKHPKEFRRAIDDLVNTFRGWLGVIIDVFGFVLRLGAALKSLGDSVGRTFRNLGDALGLNKRDVRDLGKAWDNLKTAFSAVIGALVPSLRAALRDVGAVLRGVIRVVAGLISGDWGEAWKPFGDAARAAVGAVLDNLRHGISQMGKLGSRLGNAIIDPFRKALSGLKTVAVSLINAVISVINTAIRGLNSVLRPRDLGPLGHTPGVHIDPITPINSARPTSGRTAPRSPNQGQGTPGRIRASAAALPAAGDAGGGGDVIQQFGDIVLPPAPAAAVPDARYQARQLHLLLTRQAAG